jgi:hypothetical protein
MDSGVPFSPLYIATRPMTFMGENPSAFYNGMQNYGTQSMPWVSNHFSHGMYDMSSHLPSSVSPPYANTSCGSGGMMPPSYPSPFGGRHILQTPLTIGGWNINSYESTMREVSAQICNHSTCYTLSTYPSSTMTVPMNTFPMEDLRLSSGVPSGGSHPYSTGNPPHEFPLSRGNTYSHTINPCHVAFSSQAASMPLQPIMN